MKRRREGEGYVMNIYRRNRWRVNTTRFPLASSVAIRLRHRHVVRVNRMRASLAWH